MLYRDYLRALRRVHARWKDRYELATVGNARHRPRPVPLVRVSTRGRRAGGVMLMAGFHGEEPAGPVSLLHHLHHLLGRALDLSVPLCIYPVVNPHGFDRNVRTTVDGAFTNAGFIHDVDPTGPEVALLRADMARFRPAVFLDLHEDDRENRSYLYAFGDEELAAGLTRTLHAFIPGVEGALGHDATLVARDGQIRDHHDGSAEDFMSHAGTLGSFASETPTKVPLRVRLAADLAVVDHALEWVAARRRRRHRA